MKNGLKSPDFWSFLAYFSLFLPKIIKKSLNFSF